MITSAWIVSGLCAFPQTLVFRVLKHPEVEFFQCTSMNYFDAIFNNSTILDSKQAEKIYNSLFLMVVYMVPLCVIIITYANILNKIFRSAKGDGSRQTVVVSFSLLCILHLHFVRVQILLQYVLITFSYFLQKSGERNVVEMFWMKHLKPSIKNKQIHRNTFVCLISLCCSLKT